MQLQAPEDKLNKYLLRSVFANIFQLFVKITPLVEVSGANDS